jgi:CRP/FNR family cyclic AMP-dependent transcriptional regulator
VTIDTHLETIELFAELSKRERKAVGRLMTTVSVKEGRDLMVEGTAAREFLIIIEGDATVRRKGRVVARVGAGDFLGELAVIAGVPRTATVTADTDMTVSVLNRREFSTLLDEQPKIARKVLVGAVKRLHELDPSMVK